MRSSTGGSWRFSSFLKLGLAIAAMGYLPLQLYILFGPRDGNPIGLGLLFVVGLFAGIAVVGIGLISLLWQSFSGRNQ